MAVKFRGAACGGSSEDARRELAELVEADVGEGALGRIVEHKD